MLWYFTQGGRRAASISGKIGDFGDSESMLVSTVSSELPGKAPGLLT